MSDIYVSHSDIKAFLDCRRKWHWSYVQDFKPPESLYGPLADGTRVHSAIERHYANGEDPLDHYSMICDRDGRELEESDAPPWAMDKFYEGVIVGRNCVIAHQEFVAEGNDDIYEVVDVERTIEAEIIPGVTLRGKVDVLFRDKRTGFLVINDLKTDGARNDVRDTLARSWQHTVYGVVSTLAFPDEIVDGAYYTIMRKLKRPERAKKDLVIRHKVPGSRRMYESKKVLLQRICADMVETMERLETEGNRHAYPAPSDDCRWCPFEKPCSLVDESSVAARGYLDEYYIRGGRHDRYTEEGSK